MGQKVTTAVHSIDCGAVKFRPENFQLANLSCLTQVYASSTVGHTAVVELLL